MEAHSCLSLPIQPWKNQWGQQLTSHREAACPPRMLETSSLHHENSMYPFFLDGTLARSCEVPTNKSVATNYCMASTHLAQTLLLDLRTKVYLSSEIFR